MTRAMADVSTYTCDAVTGWTDCSSHSAPPVLEPRPTSDVAADLLAISAWLHVMNIIGVGGAEHAMLIRHGRCFLARKSAVHYLELATQLFHQRVTMKHHASADLLSHTCQSAQFWYVRP